MPALTRTQKLAITLTVIAVIAVLGGWVAIAEHRNHTIVVTLGVTAQVTALLGLLVVVIGGQRRG